MARLDLDPETYILVPLFSIGALFSLFPFDVSFLGYSMSHVFYGIGHVDITIARSLSLGALGVAVFNRDLAWGDLGGLDIWITYVTFGLVVAPPFFPVFQDTVVGTPWAVVAFLIQTMGITLVTYVN